MKSKFLFLIIVLFSLCACSSTNETRSYDEYQNNHLLSLDEFFKDDLNHYFVEIYRFDCSYCENVKTSVFNYLDRQNNGENLTPLFLFNMDEGGQSANRNRFKSKPEHANNDSLIREMETNKPNTLSETYFLGTPIIYEIVDEKVDQVYLGANEVNGLLNSL